MANTIDVLIIGAGPTGLVLALELALQNTQFRILDKFTTRSDKSRALAMQPRTLELLDRYGTEAVKNELASKENSRSPAGSSIWLNRRELQGFMAPPANGTAPEKSSAFAVDSRFPGPRIISQAVTEAFLEKRLAERGVQVEHPVTVKSIAQDKDGVNVLLEKADGTQEQIRCKYVVGADGAHSIVRHNMDVQFEGEAYQQEFILADTYFDWPQGQDKLHAMLGKGLAMVMPFANGMARIIASRPGEMGKTTDADPTLADFDAALAELLPEDQRPKLHDPVWLARFHLHHRCSTKYRDGRLFIAGDAAHIHSPVGGQGMNTGIQDSINLGWKLARALTLSNTTAANTLLDTYETERRPVGQHLLAETDRMFTFLTSAGPIMRFARDLFLPYAVPMMANRSKRMMRFFTQLDVKYKRSPIVRTGPGFPGPVKGGFRAPDGKIVMEGGEEGWLLDLLVEPAHQLLLFAAGKEDVDVRGIGEKLHAAGRVDVPLHVVQNEGSKPSKAGVVDVGGALHKRYGFEGKSGYVYVRPDGYVESIGYMDDFEALLNWRNGE